MKGSIKSKIRSITELMQAPGQADVRMEYSIGDKNYHAVITMELESTRSLFVGEEYYFGFEEPTKMYTETGISAVNHAEIDRKCADWERKQAEERAMSEKKVGPCLAEQKDACISGDSLGIKHDNLDWQTNHIINILKSGCLTKKAIDIMFNSLSKTMAGE